MYRSGKVLELFNEPVETGIGDDDGLEILPNDAPLTFRYRLYNDEKGGIHEESLSDESLQEEVGSGEDSESVLSLSEMTLVGKRVSVRGRYSLERDRSHLTVKGERIVINLNGFRIGSLTIKESKYVTVYGGECTRIEVKESKWVKLKKLTASRFEEVGVRAREVEYLRLSEVNIMDNVKGEPSVNGLEVTKCKYVTLHKVNVSKLSGTVKERPGLLGLFGIKIERVNGVVLDGVRVREIENEGDLGEECNTQYDGNNAIGLSLYMVEDARVRRVSVEDIFSLNGDAIGVRYKNVEGECEEVDVKNITAYCRELKNESVTNRFPLEVGLITNNKKLLRGNVSESSIKMMLK